MTNNSLTRFVSITMKRDRLKTVLFRIMVVRILVFRILFLSTWCHVTGSVGHTQMADRIREFLGAAPQTPHPAVVRVVAQESGASSMGSGSLIWVDGDYGWVISNWHVVRGATGPIEVIFPDGFRSPAQVTKTDETWDLALLGIWRPSVTPVTLAEQVPQVGDLLMIAGYGSGSYRQAQGTCRHYAAPDPFKPQEMIELSATARQGDSGGPILNSRGELAGVLFGSGSGLTTGSHIGRVKKFLEDVSAPQLAANVNPRGLDPHVPPKGSLPPAFAPAAKLAMTISPSAVVTATTSPAQTSVDPAPFFPSIASSQSKHDTLVQKRQPIVTDELDQLQIGESEPLPFEELASVQPVNPQTRELSHQEVRPSSGGLEDRVEFSPIARLDDQKRIDNWQPRTVKSESQDDKIAKTQPEGDRSPVLLEILSVPAMKGPLNPIRDSMEQPIQLPLPLTDTNAFLVFVALVATLIYVLPRGTSKEPPGSNTTG